MDGNIIEIEVHNLATRVTRLEEDSRKAEESRGNIYERLAVVEKENYGAEYRFKELSKDITEVKNDVSDIKNSVKEIKEKPVRRYETVVAALLSAFVGGAATFIISKLAGG